MPATQPQLPETAEPKNEIEMSVIRNRSPRGERNSGFASHVTSKIAAPKGPSFYLRRMFSSEHFKLSQVSFFIVIVCF